MGKKNTSVWIEEEHIEKLKKHGLRLSDTINNYLTFYIEVLDSSEKELFNEMQEIQDTIKNKQLELETIKRRLFELNDEEEES